MTEMTALRWAYTVASINLGFWTWPMAKEMIGKDLCYGIMWTAVISMWIYRKWFHIPKPLDGTIDIEFKEIRR